MTPLDPCRFCSGPGPSVSLLECASFTDTTIADAITDLTQVTLDESRGSLTICTADCLVRLEECYRFRERVQQAETANERFESADIKLEIIEEDGSQFDAEFLDDSEPVGKFVMPRESLIVSHLKFEHFDYVEFEGERCCGCEMICGTAEELEGHCREWHPPLGEVSEYGCSVCSRNFCSSDELNEHRECYSTKELLVCKLCQLAFLSQDALMSHMEESSVHQSNDEELEAEEDDDFVEPPAAEGQDIEVEYALSETKLEFSRSNLPDDKLISSFEDFDQYRVITVEDSAERCCACGVFFQSLEQLLEHARLEHHDGKNPTEGDPVCEVCSETFRTLSSLNTHKTLCRFVKKLFYCKLCQLVYTRRFQIVKHFKNTPNHADCFDEPVRKKKVEHPPQQERIKSGFACCFLRCSEIFEQESQLMSHAKEQHAPRRVINFSQRTSEEFACTVCYRNFSSQQMLLLHRNRTLKKKHICSFCGEAFLIPSKLREHTELVHSQSVPQHPCDVCGKTFRTTSLLRAHQLTHDESRDFACDQCAARFRFRFQLRKHLNGVHPTSFPYKCAFCEKKFAVKAKHDLHVRSHTGEKPYTCRFEACGKQFSHVTDRKRHEMGLHTGERPYRCEHCLAGFIRKRELLIHAQKHQLQVQEA